MSEFTKDCNLCGNIMGGDWNTKGCAYPVECVVFTCDNDDCDNEETYYHESRCIPLTPEYMTMLRKFGNAVETTDADFARFLINHWETEHIE